MVPGVVAYAASGAENTRRVDHTVERVEGTRPLIPGLRPHPRTLDSVPDRASRSGGVRCQSTY
jgi:hypothetical protein